MMRNDFDKGEFMDFMDEFLNQHPDVVKDQELGWDIYWHLTRFDPSELNPQQFEEPENPAMETFRVTGSIPSSYQYPAWMDSWSLSSQSPGRPKIDLASTGGGSDQRIDPGAQLIRH